MKTPVAPDHWEQVAEAFSRKATEYDEFGTDHPNLARMRARVYSHFEAFVTRGARVLELNAGTGTDATYLVRRGYRVHATDIAPGMLAAIEEKAKVYGLTDRLTVENRSFIELDQVRGRPFDAVFSNFGGLNCLGDLTLVTRHLGRVLVPGGVVTWVIMPPICPWEWLTLLLGDLRTPFRRLRPGGVIAHVSGVSFRTHYFTPSRVRRAFGPEYQMIGLEGVSLFAPPANRKGFARRFPRTYAALVGLDDLVAKWPLFRNWGDFFILSLRYRGHDNT